MYVCMYVCIFMYVCMYGMYLSTHLGSLDKFQRYSSRCANLSPPHTSQHHMYQMAVKNYPILRKIIKMSIGMSICISTCMSI